MKVKGYAVTYAGESNECNKENYYLNGICKEDVEILRSYTINKDTRSRNLYAISSAANSEVAGMDIAYIAVDVLKGFFGTDFTTENSEYFKIANGAIASHVFESGNERFDVESSVVYVDKDVATVYNIGTAPVYYYTGGEIKVVSGSVPDTVQVKKTSYNDYGILQVKDVTKETAKHLGVLDDNCEVVPYVSESIQIKNDAYFVLCCDALAKLVDAAEIKKVLEDKKIKDANKASAIAEKAINADPEGNYTVVVVTVKKGMAIAQAELRSFYRWVAIAAACGLFCAFGEGIAVGIGNMVKGFESFVDYYTMGEDEDKDVPLYVPKDKKDDKAAEDKKSVTEQTEEAAEETAEDTTPAQSKPVSGNAGGKSGSASGKGTSNSKPTAPKTTTPAATTPQTTAPQTTAPQASTPQSGATQSTPQPVAAQPAPAPAPAQPAPAAPAPSGGSLPIDN